jgi:iron(III) transport system ATP-binding protein
MTIILALDQISKQFRGAKTPVLQAISFTLHQGELLSLLGSSGCGKTTLLRVIAGFEAPQSGTIQLAGQCVAAADRGLPPERRDIGMVFQDYALFPHLSVANNVAFGLKRSHRHRSAPTSRQIQQRVTETLALVKLNGFEQRYPHQLSGGQQQRVALARALAPQPSLILFDEPLSNLDVQVRLTLRQEIREILKRTGTAAIFVTHDQEEALSISDRMAVLNHGQIEQIGTPEDLYQSPHTRFVAEFVAQANLLPATFANGTWQTEINHFPAVTVPTSPAAWLMLHQQDLQLAADETSPIVIGDRAFLGGQHRYLVITPSGQRLQALSQAQPPFAIGTRVKLHMTSTQHRLFAVTEPGARL